MSEAAASATGALTGQLWASIEDTYHAIREHPFVAGLTDGSLERDSFEFYVIQDSHYLREYARALSIAAAFAALRPADLSEGIVTEYAPGAPIGWHRDAPGFGVVVGISLLAAARFRFRRGKVGAWETVEVRLEPRSIYVLTGPARTEWQHNIPPVDALRYSVTFRTLRKRA